MALVLQRPRAALIRAFDRRWNYHLWTDEPSYLIFFAAVPLAFRKIANPFTQGIRGCPQPLPYPHLDPVKGPGMAPPVITRSFVTCIFTPRESAQQSVTGPLPHWLPWGAGGVLSNIIWPPHYLIHIKRVFSFFSCPPLYMKKTENMFYIIR